MILEPEIERLKILVNKLIESASNKIDSLSEMQGSELIKNEKILTDILNKLVKIIIDIDKSLANKKEVIKITNNDEEIINQFYKNYKLGRYDDKR